MQSQRLCYRCPVTEAELHQAPLMCDPLVLAARLFSGYCSAGLSSLIIAACALHAQHARTRSPWPRQGSVPPSASAVFPWWQNPSVHGKGDLGTRFASGRSSWEAPARKNITRRYKSSNSSSAVNLERVELYAGNKFTI